MDDAICCFEARFKSEADAKEALLKVQDFFKEGLEAHKYWDANREKSPDEFWSEFRERFPRVCECLGDLVGNKKFCLELAGELDFGPEEDIKTMFEVENNALTYVTRVWGRTDWDHLVKYLKSKFGAVEAEWHNLDEGFGGGDVTEGYE
jgi:hypothetical protein